MLKRIRIQGLGPHVDFRAELDPRGPNTLSGPSEAGKSFVIEAVLFALFGRSASGRFRPEAIHDGAPKAVVELTLDSGRTLRRSATRTKQTRTIVVADEETAYATEDLFAQALGDLGRDPDAVELALVPLAWTGLASGNARALRDVLARVLPGGDTRTEVLALCSAAGVAVSEVEAAQDESAVSATRRTVRRERDEAKGRASLAEERLTTLLGQAPPDAGPAPDPALVARVEAWDRFDRSAGASVARSAAVAAAADWDRRASALGAEPPAPPDPGPRAAQARATLQQAWQAAQQAGAQHQMLAMQRQMFAGSGETCPTCGRGGWTQGAAMAAGLELQVSTARAMAEAANANIATLQAEVAAAEEVERATQEGLARREAWRRAAAAMGSRPSVPDPAADAVEAPAEPRPSPGEVEQVRRHASGAAGAGAARERFQRELAEARAVVARETAQHAAAEAESTRLDALLDAVRQAPSILAARQAQALGDVGPVTLEFGENPAVRVLVDGRPWWLASRGRLVVADAALRAALRRAMQMPWLVLFVDNVQDVGGQPLPELTGPVVFLQTTDGKGIHVRRKVPRDGGSTEG